METTSTEEERTTTPKTDFQFIRGTMDRVCGFHAGSTSDSSNFVEDLSEGNKKNASSSPSSSDKGSAKDPTQYLVIEEIERFHDASTKAGSDSKKKSTRQVTNLDDVIMSNDSSTSNDLYARSHPANAKKKPATKAKSSDHEPGSSEEVDDTLNDIEDDDYQYDKLKRQATNRSSHTSNENSPVHSAGNQAKLKKTSQETQTFARVCRTKYFLQEQAISPFPSVSISRRDRIVVSSGENKYMPPRPPPSAPHSQRNRALT